MFRNGSGNNSHEHGFNGGLFIALFTLILSALSSSNCTLGRCFACLLVMETLIYVEHVELCFVYTMLAVLFFCLSFIYFKPTKPLEHVDMQVGHVLEGNGPYVHCSCQFFNQSIVSNDFSCRSV